MARFLARATGRAKTPATRLGNPSSGIKTDCNGWNLGVTVYGEQTDDGDSFAVFVTGGSTPSFSNRHLATVCETEDGFQIELSSGELLSFDRFGHQVIEDN